MKNILRRLVFVLLSATVMVFFSEKAFWYVQGYTIVGLVLYYAVPVYTCLWALDYFRVRRLSGVVLIAALYAFLVEGVLTAVIYEAGLLDPVMPAYFIGWHGFLSVVFGWYLLRKWLVAGQWLRVLVSSAVFGLFWGLWAVTFWLPEAVIDFQQLAAQGEPVIPGAWPVLEFALHSFAFTIMLMTAHWLLGRGLWVDRFQPGWLEKALLLMALAVLFGFTVLAVMPLAGFKLAFLLGIVLVPLALSRRREPGPSLLAALNGSLDLRHVLALLAMPLGAVLVYAVMSWLQPPEDALRVLLEVIPILQGLGGAALFVWALAATLWAKPRPVLVDAV